MATVSFTQNIQRHVSCPSTRAEGTTVAAVMEHVFRDNPAARSYILDDQGAVRKHIVIFVDGAPLRDRTALSDPVADDAEVYVMQALSGG